MRLVKEASSVHRYPEAESSSPAPTGVTSASNADPNSNRVVVMAALDNLMKGAAGQAGAGLNIRCGFPETTARVRGAPSHLAIPPSRGQGH